MPSIVAVAGDPSGDQHAAHLIAALKARQPNLTFTGLGGPAMRAAGVALLEDLTATAAIGPFDAARHLSTFLRAQQLLRASIQRQKPDLALLVDFGDYNLPVIAPLLKRHKIPVLYYVSPQLWAWGRFRLRWVRRYVDRMIVFFPFEETFYREAGVPVTWVGHPLVESAKPARAREEALRAFGLQEKIGPIVGLLPGSRADEVRRHLPLMISAAKRVSWRVPAAQFLIPRAPSVDPSWLAAAREVPGLDLHVADGPAADALQLMDAAVVTSGTATLETALASVPMVVVYKTSWPTYLAARAVVRIPDIALVNVVAGRRVVPEFVQHRARPGAIARGVIELLQDVKARETMKKGLREVKKALGPSGAVDRAAEAVLEELKDQMSEIRGQKSEKAR